MEDELTPYSDDGLESDLETGPPPSSRPASPLQDVGGQGEGQDLEHQPDTPPSGPASPPPSQAPAQDEVDRQLSTPPLAHSLLLDSADLQGAAALPGPSQQRWDPLPRHHVGRGPHPTGRGRGGCPQSTRSLGARSKLNHNIPRGTLCPDTRQRDIWRPTSAWSGTPGTGPQRGGQGGRGQALSSGLLPHGEDRLQIGRGGHSAGARHGRGGRVHHVQPARRGFRDAQDRQFRDALQVLSVLVFRI